MAAELDPESKLPAAFTPEAYQLPMPGLEWDFRLVASLEERISVGSTPAGGHRNWITICGGSFSGRWGSGTIVPGGQDNQVVAGDLSTRVSTHYLLRTSDPEPAYITVHTEGWRTGSKEVLEKLFDPVQAEGVDPALYSFRLYIHLETGDERYKHLSTGMWIGSGARRGRSVIYDAYRIR